MTNSGVTKPSSGTKAGADADCLHGSYRCLDGSIDSSGGAVGSLWRLSTLTSALDDLDQILIERDYF
jgi:hypothetical protein